MPIECKFPVCPLDQDAFHAIDKMVVGHAFDIHNEFGRFCGERIYGINFQGANIQFKPLEKK